MPQCLKITEKVSFNSASEASYLYILYGKKVIKNGYIVVLIKEMEGAITLKKTKGVHNVERGEILLCLGGAA